MAELDEQRVYFAVSGKEVKIGTSNNPPKRIKGTQIVKMLLGQRTHREYLGLELVVVLRALGCTTRMIVFRENGVRIQ
jgi:hypothetical protein